MNFLDTFSGIGAAGAAWHPLGWQCLGHAEIEKFPSAVLSARFPAVANFGDCRLFMEWPDLGAVDLVCGGTPCQSFSVAGLRGGLKDPRGELTLTFLAIVDRYRPRWLVWENTAGVLSDDGGRSFAAILGALGLLGYGWCYRVLDAQYVRVDGFPRAVPQRRRRVFLVGYLGDWRRAAAVLSERQSLSGHHPPRRRAGKGFAADLAPSLVGGGCGVERAGESRGQDPLVAVQPVANSLTHRMHKGVNTTMDEGQTMVAVAHTLRAEGFDASEDGTGRGPPLIPIAFSGKDYGADATLDLSPTLRAMGHDQSHANAGGQLAIAIQERASSENLDTIADGRARIGPDGKGWNDSGAAYTVEARQTPQAVAFQPRFARNDRGAPGEIAHALTAEPGRTGKGDSAQCVAYPVETRWAVRRLMPVECERLMGFPDGWTDIPYTGGKRAADGPRYKALGNSWAVNCARWIGQRIEMVDALFGERREAAE